MSADEPTVFVVDDDPDVRDSLRWLIESVDLPVETFACAEDFLAMYSVGRPGCLLLDMRMPGMGGFGLMEQMDARRIHVPVIVITGHGDVPMAVRAMKRGAMDFLQKPFNDQELLDRLQAALKLDQRTRSEAAARHDLANRAARLTSREKEVLERIVLGHPNKVISGELGISERTVETHRARIMEKMQARSLPELVRMSLIVRGDT